MLQAERLGVMEGLAAGSVGVADLVGRLGVSAATVRRDLEHLEGSTSSCGRTAARWRGSSPTNCRWYKAGSRSAGSAGGRPHVHEGAVIGLTGGTTTTEVAREVVDR